VENAERIASASSNQPAMTVRRKAQLNSETVLSDGRWMLDMG
jgi:hypothetical protein